MSSPVPPASGGAGGAKSAPPAYFVDHKKGEVNELKAVLRTVATEKDSDRKRDIIKKVIAYMTLGIDVSRLFSEMVLASNTRDLVVKKMVFLFLCNYASENAELTLLAINTLQKDCRNEDPIVRGLALRSLCSLNQHAILEYVIAPLKASLMDPSPYVRKTGVIGVLKVFHLAKDIGRDPDMVDRMYAMIRDRDPQVVTNCILVLNEMLAEEGGIAINQVMVHHLLNRIREFTEWGQCVVLELVNRYVPGSPEETFQIMNLLDVCLRVSNSAVVLAACKCFLHLTRSMPDIQQQVYLRMKTPLLTLMASPSSEISYCVLGHVNLIVEKCPGLFDSEYKQFFCRFNDPTCVKHLKLSTLPKICNEGNVAEVLAELAEYVSDVDVDMARHAIRAIGKISVRLPAGSDRVITCLLELSELDVDYVRAEVVIVMRDLLRKFPRRAVDVIPALSRCLKTMDEPEAKAAVVWMLGEFGTLIMKAPYMLEPLIDGIADEESVAVKLELLTATVKLFFKRPGEMQHMMGRLFKAALNDNSSAAVRDRALLYYRLLRRSVNDAQAVIVGGAEQVTMFLEDGASELKEKVFAQFNTLSVLYETPCEQFVDAAHMLATREVAGPASTAAIVPEPVADLTYASNDLLGVGASPPAAASAPVSTGPSPAATLVAPRAAPVDLLGDFFGPATPAPAPVATPASRFALNPAAALSPQDFQGKWLSLPALPVVSARLARRLGVKDLENVLTSLNLRAIASGDAGATFKLFMFAQEDRGQYFLTEIVVDKNTNILTANVKCDAGASSSEFESLLQRTFSSL